MVPFANISTSSFSLALALLGISLVGIGEGTSKEKSGRLPSGSSEDPRILFCAELEHCIWVNILYRWSRLQERVDGVLIHQ